MQGVTGKKMNGLGDGMSRYMRANRSALLPSLDQMRREQTHSERNLALEGRLEELLVFEILKEG